MPEAAGANPAFAAVTDALRCATPSLQAAERLNRNTLRLGATQTLTMQRVSDEAGRSSALRGLEPLFWARKVVRGLNGSRNRRGAAYNERGDRSRVVRTAPAVMDCDEERAL